MSLSTQLAYTSCRLSRYLCVVTRTNQNVKRAPKFISQRNFGSNSKGRKINDRFPASHEPPTLGKFVYVHPISQIILQHLESTCSSFLIETGLDRGFALNGDGTFVLYFPSDSNGNFGGDKIWTSYDPDEKKHWLIVNKGNLVGNFLLQDNLKPAWHSSRQSMPQKVKSAVDSMISKIQENI